MKRALIIITLLTLATAIVAQERKMRERVNDEDIVSALQLTTDQQSVWNAAHSEFEATAEPLMEQERALARQIEADLKSASPDACSLGGELIAQHALSKQIRAAHETLKSKISAVLTPDQKTRLDAISTMHERHAF